MADRSAHKRVARALNKGRNPIAGFAAAARKSVATRNGPKASETHHLQSDQFGGKHHAPSNSTSVAKNNSGSMSAPSTGRHSLANGKVGHRGSYDREHDVAGGYKDMVGAGRVGKHRKPGA